MNIAVLMTCHNRRDKTLSSLNALFRISLPENAVLHVILVDDGSSDGTSEAIKANFPSVEILFGDGNLFWNRGMHWAFDHALKDHYDAYLWLNDDTVLLSDALINLTGTYSDLAARFGPEIVVVGSTRNSEGLLSYGGSLGLSRVRRFQYRKVWDASKPVECHVMNGNCVLIPRCVANRVGNIDPFFEHAMGDTDYALRVRAEGGRVFVAPGFVGECANNPIENTFKDRRLSVRERWAHMTSRKGLPVRSWYRFTRRHGGKLWPLYFIWPYLRAIA